MAEAAPPKSPTSVGVRRKGPKTLPKLPLSAFTPPNSGVGERFPLPPSPSNVHPDSVIDAHVRAKGGDLSKWQSETGQALGGRVGGVIVSLQSEDGDVEKIVEAISSKTDSIPIVSISVPISLAGGVPANPPSYLTASKVPISIISTFTEASPKYAEGLKWALSQGYTVDIDVQTQSDFQNAEAWESLEDTLDKTLEGLEDKGTLVLSNILPPPHTLTVPIVKLLSHPSYIAYQSHLASLSLFSSIYIKFLPPTWDAPTPQTPSAGQDVTPVTPSDDTVDELDSREWKRRIKMYLGPAIEAFGFGRILFGSSPSVASSSASNAADWYDLARDCFAELAIEQEGVNAVFANNAKKVYGRA